MRLIILLLALALAMPGTSSAFNKCGAFDNGSSATAAAGHLTAGISFCHDTTTTATSPVLVSDADHFSFEVQPDMGSTGTGCTVQLYRCVSAAPTISQDCLEICPDSDFDGAPNCGTTLDGVTVGRRGMDWQTAKFLKVVVTANPGADNCRTMLSGW